MPFQLIKGFLKIYTKQHTRKTFIFCKLQNFHNCRDIFSNKSTRNKTYFLLTYKRRKMICNSTGLQLLSDNGPFFFLWKYDNNLTYSKESLKASTRCCLISHHITKDLTTLMHSSIVG